MEATSDLPICDLPKNERAHISQTYRRLFIRRTTGGVDVLFAADCSGAFGDLSHLLHLASPVWFSPGRSAIPRRLVGTLLSPGAGAFRPDAFADDIAAVLS